MSSSGTEAPARLLIRDLAQVVTPRGRTSPLRGAELGAIDILEDAYILCAQGRIEAVGAMKDLKTLDAEVEELDGRGLSAIPGFVDCHTHACFAGDRVEEFALRAAGAGYEELHAAGGGILATVRATRAGRRERPRRGARAPRCLDASLRDDDLRGKVGIRPRSRDRACPAPNDSGGRRSSDLARCACGPARVRRRRLRSLCRLPHRGGASRSRSHCRGGRRLPRARRVRRRRSRPVPTRVPRCRPGTSPAR